MPVVGVTKASHVEDALRAATIILATDEATKLGQLADQAGLDTRDS